MSAQPVYRTCESSLGRLPTKLPTPRTKRLHRWMFSDLLKHPLEIVSPPALQGIEKHIAPKHLKYIGSYNWIDAPTPTIIVPGCPPIWAEKRAPLIVPRDNGRDFIDQNGYHMKRRFTLLPLIRAVQTITNRKTSKFDWPSVDFVADRGALRKLAAWANDKSGHWRMDTQLAGHNTVLINSWPPVTKQTIGHSDSYGYNFEKACTHPAPGCESGTGHHRIITYDFGGLTMVVRFEVDACLPFPTTRSRRKSGNARNHAKSAPGAQAWGTDTPTFRTVSKPTLRFPHVAVIRAGSRVPQSHLIELKTYSGAKKHWNRSYPQLFLSQTPHIYYGAHKNGEFSEIKKYTLGEPHLKPIDHNAQVAFKKLKVALEAIQELVGKHGTNGRITLVCTGKELGVYQRENAGSCLPKYALALFRL
ncbi:hypothetical protein BJ322DRAFT_1114053 [Thelephora terrestris]|uniref:Uncharacterized protein n=1 Tax=Thelephora terrestris TaxID=56493 RepID=A0A9P6H4F8_9AGAM|nr:hypothetical protein BJ322DRAFT_1114053 [Thelephora terrestris]